MSARLLAVAKLSLAILRAVADADPRCPTCRGDVLGNRPRCILHEAEAAIAEEEHLRTLSPVVVPTYVAVHGEDITSVLETDRGLSILQNARPGALLFDRAATLRLRVELGRQRVGAARFRATEVAR